jgi:membrane protein DedA with SNARE-associated domain
MIQGFVEQFGYFAILALLLGAGVGVPLPEELTQLTAGFLAHQGYLRLAPAIAACWVGIVAGDFLFFSLARRHGDAVMESRPVRRVLTPQRRAWLERHFARHAFWTIVVARHSSGLRLPAFALAGTHGVRRGTFLLADGLSALVSVPLVVTVGYLASHHLAEAHRDLRRAELAIVAAVALAALVAYAVRARRRRIAARRGPGAAVTER